MAVGNANGSTSSLSNIAMALNNDSAFNNTPTSSSPLNFASSSISTTASGQQIRNQSQKLPIAMALNEYIHVWFKGEDSTK